MSERSMFGSVDDLEAVLVRAMAPAHLDPPSASVVALRQAALSRRRLEAPIAVGALRWHRKLALMFAVVGAGTVGGTSVALAHPVLPGALRQVATVIGLPVDSQPVADVKSESRELQRALDRADRPIVARDLKDLDQSQARLDPEDRTRMAATLDDLEKRARALSVPEPTLSPPAQVNDDDHRTPPAQADHVEHAATTPLSTGSGDLRDSDAQALAKPAGGASRASDSAHTDPIPSDRAVPAPENASDEPTRPAPSASEIDQIP